MLGESWLRRENNPEVSNNLNILNPINYEKLVSVIPSGYMYLCVYIYEWCKMSALQILGLWKVNLSIQAEILGLFIWTK
jgi:hypothetical protein